MSLAAVFLMMSKMPNFYPFSIISMLSLNFPFLLVSTRKHENENTVLHE